MALGVGLLFRGLPAACHALTAQRGEHAERRMRFRCAETIGGDQSKACSSASRESMAPDIRHTDMKTRKEKLMNRIDS